MIGTPPSCRPQCITNSDCGQSEACINNKCQDPCLNACVYGSECRVQNHIATCQCPAGYTGDAFKGCIIMRDPVPSDPCNPSPCGTNARCENGNCFCVDDYQGDPYISCRPECVTSNDCPSNKACLRQHCVDPCKDLCAQNAICTVRNHVPSCNCPDHMVGDPYTQCRVQDVPQPTNPCHPSPCGQNSQCRESSNGQAICTCLPSMIGSPPNCRPECTTSAECDLSKSCENYHCVNPCSTNTCGTNAQCRVVSHSPMCRCLDGYEGNPFVRCDLPRKDEPIAPKNPCYPSPCGPNSQCREINGIPACTCLESYIGSPPNCRPECLVNSECSRLQACMNNNKCGDPCLNTCGNNAKCTVINHNAVCTCLEGFRGDPFYSCEKVQGINFSFDSIFQYHSNFKNPF